MAKRKRRRSIYKRKAREVVGRTLRTGKKLYRHERGGYVDSDGVYYCGFDTPLCGCSSELPANLLEKPMPLAEEAIQELMMGSS